MKLWYMCTTEYNAAQGTKKNNAILCNLDEAANAILSEGRRRNKHRMISLMCDISNNRIRKCSVQKGALRSHLTLEYIEETDREGKK